MEKALTLDYSQKDSSLQIFPVLPTISSQQAGWNGIQLEYHQYFAYQVPECKPLQHLIVIYNNASTRFIERQLDGHFQSECITKGDIVISPANVLHKASWRNNIEFVLIILEPALIECTAFEFNHSDKIEILPHFAQQDWLIYQIGLQLKSELEKSEYVSRLYADYAAHLLAVHLVEHYSTKTQPTKEYTDGRLPQQKLKQVTDYIWSHLNQNFGIAELAQLVNMSSSHFGRQFKQSTRLTPHQYLIECRLEEVRRLLANTNLTIDEIAQRTGFNSHSHLTKRFRQHMLMTPYAYRQML
ncbi:MAG: AraC family transcriptional regulator [Rivularia sp. (in: cyanobacteria)]